jgi:type II secretory pathway component GspD/PulD (secretin)
VISTRELSTHLFVRNGQTAVLGGLVSRETGRTRSGIPFLSAIPILGVLFGSTKNTDNNTELFLFLTPHIVMTDEDLERVRKELEQHSDMLKDGKTSQPLISPPTTGPAPTVPVRPPPSQ